jgi:hypothetical protein
MSSPIPLCRTIKVIAFRGDRSRVFVSAFLQALDDQENGRGPGPTFLQCFLYSGHTGVSTNGGATVFGFNPDGSSLPVWQLFDRLKNGDAFAGVVRDDTAVFVAARTHSLQLLFFDVTLPDPQFQRFTNSLDAEKKKNQYSYGFPNGDGDCNCTTWLERLGLPLLTGRMDEFVRISGVASGVSRRFGECI